MHVYTPGFIIAGPREDGEQLFWSNEFGWASRDVASRFFDVDQHKLIGETGRQDADGRPWIFAPELLPREQLVAALECVENLFTAYARGELNDGIDWEELDATVEAAASAFPALYEQRRQVVEAELEEEDAE